MIDLTYTPPLCRIYRIAAHTALATSVVVPGATISEAEEEEWTVS